MITRYGMSDSFGMVAMETVNNQYLGGDTSLACSADTQNEIDRKVIELIRTQHEKARKILSENRQKLTSCHVFCTKRRRLPARNSWKFSTDRNSRKHFLRTQKVNHTKKSSPKRDWIFLSLYLIYVLSMPSLTACAMSRIACSTSRRFAISAAEWIYRVGMLTAPTLTPPGGSLNRTGVRAAKFHNFPLYRNVVFLRDTIQRLLYLLVTDDE